MTNDKQNSDRYQLSRQIKPDRPILNRSHSVTESSPGRLSRLDLSRRSLSLAERQKVFRKVTADSDRVSSSNRMCRDNISQLLSDKLQGR